MVYRARTKREDLHCLENDKLTGAWMTLEALSKLRREGVMESWSRITFDTMI